MYCYTMVTVHVLLHHVWLQFMYCYTLVVTVHVLLHHGGYSSCIVTPWWLQFMYCYTMVVTVHVLLCYGGNIDVL